MLPVPLGLILVFLSMVSLFAWFMLLSAYHIHSKFQDRVVIMLGLGAILLFFIGVGCLFKGI